MRVAVGALGGTFDPPHLGHLALASIAHVQLELEKVLFVLTADPPHKQDRQISPANIRLEMLKAAIDDQEAFSISRVDLDRPSPHYAVDTVRLLRKEFPKTDIVYLIGSDSLEDLPTWHRPADFLDGIDKLAVMGRPGSAIEMDAIKEKLPGLEGKLEFVQAPGLNISSSTVRKRVREGKSYSYFLPQKVSEVIQQNALYS